MLPATFVQELSPKTDSQGVEFHNAKKKKVCCFIFSMMLSPAHLLICACVLSGVSTMEGVQRDLSQEWLNDIMAQKGRILVAFLWQMVRPESLANAAKVLW